MIITNRANGPQFSTDAVAHDVSRFIAQRRSFAANAGPADASPGMPGTVEELYPSLFEVPSASLGRLVAAVLDRVASRIGSIFQHPHGSRRMITGLALGIAFLIGGGPASADVPVYANGFGHAPDLFTAYTMALNEAEQSLESVCSSNEEVATERILESHDRWNGTEYEMTVRLSILCR